MAHEHQRRRAPGPVAIVLLLGLEIGVQQCHQLSGLLAFQARLQLLCRLLQRRLRIVPTAADKCQQYRQRRYFPSTPRTSL